MTSTSTAAPAPGATTSTAPPITYVIREGTPADLGFVLKTWPKTYRESGFGRCIRTDVFHRGMDARIKRLLAKPSVRLLCASPDPRNVVLYGFAVVEGDVLHYVHVKEAWRRVGIARALLSSLPINFRFSHRLGGDVERLIRSKLPHAVYDPFAAEVP